MNTTPQTLEDLARRCTIDQFDVRRLKNELDSLDEVSVEALVDSLVAGQAFRGAVAVVIAASLAGKPVDARYVRQLAGLEDGISHPRSQRAPGPVGGGRSHGSKRGKGHAPYRPSIDP